MMKRSQRGAAKVSVVWAICLFMAFAAAAVAYFMANQATAAETERADRAEKESKKAVDELDVEKSYVREIALKAGFTDPTGPARIEVRNWRRASSSSRTTSPRSTAR